MADGPGARIVDRVGVLVLPDTSKFKPALKKYLERISRRERVEIGVDLDSDGLNRDVKAATKRASGGAKVQASAGLEDGFLSQMQRDVNAALRSVEADVPLTADGERLRREARAKVAEIQSTMSRMALEVPLDPEAGAAAKADLKAEIAGLQALAKTQKIDVPLGVDANALSGLAKGAGGLGGGAGGLGGLTGPGGAAAIVALIGNAVIALGLTLAALPALMMSIIAPLGVIALGWDGIALAAKEAKPGFDALRTAVSARFAEDLAPVFSQLGEALPKLIPSMTSLAGALSGAFSGVIDTLTSPEGLEKITAIIDNITRAVQVLSPVLGPMVDVFLDFAVTGTKAFADNAPMLLGALQTMIDLFTWLNDSGVLAAAVTGFTQMVTLAVLFLGGLVALSIGIAAAYTWVMALAHGFMGWLIPQTIAAVGAVAAFALGLATHLATLPLLALPAVMALGDVIGGGVTSAMGLGMSAASLGVSLLGAAVGLLPSVIAAALSNLGSTLSGIVSGGFSLASSAASVGVSLVVAIAGTLPGLVLGVLASLGSSLFSLALSALGSMAGGVSSGGLSVILTATSLAVSIVAAFANLGATLFSKGAGMIGSLASGMLSKLPSVTSAAGSIAGSIAGFFRGSPVKEGPLKSWNHGQDTSGAGRKMIADMAAGMASQRRAVASAASGVAGAVSSSSDVTLGAAGGGSIEDRLERALAGWKPSVQLGEQEFFGVMQRTAKNRRGRG